MASAKDAYRQAMRDDLLAAAQAVVARKGLAGLTIREVLTEAGVAPGTLYAYFAGKDDLLAAMAEKVVGRVLDQAESGDATPSQLVFWAMTEQALTRPIEGSSLLADVRGRAAGPAHAEMVKGINNELVAGMRPLVEQVRESGDIRSDDLDALIELLDIVWDGLTRRHGADTFVTSYERVGKVLLSLLRPPQD